MKVGSLILFLIFSFFAFSESNPLSINYTIKDGLPSNEIYKIIEDSKGYIWIASDGGITRYDGKEFITFDETNGLNDAVVFELFEDFKGRIWYATSSKRIGYISNLKINELKIDLSKYQKNKNTTTFIKSLYVDKNDQIWFGFSATGQILTMKKPYKKAIVLHNNKNSIYSFNQSNFIFSEQFNFKIIENEVWEFFSINRSKTTFNNKIALKNTLNSQIHLCEKISPNSFVISSNKSIYLINNKKVKLLAKFENEIIDISIGKNEIFVGLYQGGLKILSNYTKKLQIESYFNTESVTSVIKNNMNEYWVSTLNKGLFYIPGFKNILITKNSEKTLSHIIQVYRQTDSSFITLDNSGNILKNEFLILNEPFCKTFSIHKSNVFYNGTNSGVFISQHLKKSTFYSSSYKANLAFKKYFNYKNEIYSFSNNLIFSIDKNYKQHKVLFVRNRIYFVSIHNNILWISTEKGLYTYDLEKKKFEKRFNTIKSRINSILIANDKIYLSTKGEGLYECSKTKVIQHFTTKNGLLSNFSNDLYLDKKNTLWILTKKGINFIQKEAKTIESAHFVNHFFDEKIYSFSIDKEDLFLCSDKGVFKFADYSSLLNHNSNLKVYFEDQKIKAKNSSIFFGFFPAKKYSFHTKLNCLLYKNLGNIQYEYRLLPQSKSWQKSSLSRINFTDLKYGDYVLEVRSLLSNDEKTKTSTFLFTIEKQYFETWWFFILCIVSIVLIFYFFYKYIQSNTKKRERKKQENQLMLSQMESKALRAQMNPHFIFNAMNSIQNFLLSDQEIEAVTFLGKFARLIRNILESTKSELITIKNEREILETYIELEQLRCSYSFDFEFTIDESISLEASQIPSMIIQPFIENAIIHGLIPLTERKGLLQIYFSQNEENFFCTVEDNGVGRKQAQINNEKNRKFHTSMGMGITFDRIEQIQKMYGKTVSIQIIDKPEVENMSSGTKIIINFPKLNLPL